jgi:hypothetical protein
MPTTVTLETAARHGGSPTGARGAFGYLDRDGRFIGAKVVKTPSAATTPGASEHSADATATSTHSEPPENPRELIGMAFYVNVSSIGVYSFTTKLYCHLI